MQASNQNLWKKKRLLHLGWDMLGECVERINVQIEASDFQPTTIIGISRGGLGLAVAFPNSRLFRTVLLRPESTTSRLLPMEAFAPRVI